MQLETTEINARIDAALAIIHGQYLRRSLTTALSGGELAKVVFAGQMAMHTDVLVLDEGTVMLDPKNRRILLDTVRELNRDFGRTIVHISHRLDDLEAAGAIAAIDEGAVALRSDGVFDLVRRMADHPLPGIEPGDRIVFQAFLRERGIVEEDLDRAAEELARRIKGRGTP
jgi:energy-coupling factor transport system ATP-binding protein